MLGRWTASQIAAASAGSFLPRLPLIPNLPKDWCYELGGHQLDGVAMLGKEPGPVVGARAGLDADGAGRQAGDELVQLGAHDPGLAQHDSTAGVPMRLEEVKGAARSQTLIPENMYE